MHFLSLVGLIFLSPTFWHDLMVQTPVRVIALAGSVAVLEQLVKVFLPKLVSGKIAIAFNVVLSVAGVLAGMNPANFWTETTLAQVLMVAAAAAGVHGTAKSLSARWAAVGAPQPAPLPPAGGAWAGEDSPNKRQPVSGGWVGAGMGSTGSVGIGNSAAKLNTSPTDPQLATEGAKPVPKA